MEELNYITESANSKINQSRSGVEKEKIKNGYRHIKGQWGSERIQKLSGSDNKAIGGIHLIHLDGKTVLTGIFVEEEYRRQGIATELVEFAKKNHKNLEISEHKTNDGKKLFESIDSKDDFAVKTLKEHNISGDITAGIHVTSTPENVSGILSKGFDLRKAGATDKIHGMQEVVRTTPYAVFASPEKGHYIPDGTPYIKLGLSEKARVILYDGDATAFKNKLYDHLEANDRRDLTQKLKKSGIDAICSRDGTDEMIVINKKVIKISEGGLWNEQVFEKKPKEKSLTM